MTQTPNRHKRKKSSRQRKIKLPRGVSEEELLKIISGVVNRLAYKFKFGYHDVDDIKQQGTLYALQCLKNYDGQRPLENFIWTHVRNRLFNYKRDNFERPEKPCLECPEGSYHKDGVKCLKYENINQCMWYCSWKRRNNSKKNLMKPIELSSVSDETENSMKIEDNVCDILSHYEIFTIIDNNIPAGLRKDWLLVYNNESVPKYRRLKLQIAIQKILEEHNIDAEKTWET